MKIMMTILWKLCNLQASRVMEVWSPSNQNKLQTHRGS